MALSAAAHHSFDKVAAGEKYDGLRAQRTDRAGEAANSALWRQKSIAAGDAVFFELFDEDTAGLRPTGQVEPRPQERVHRHTVEHIVDFVRFAPMVQILDAPVPQMVEQWLNILHFFDTLMPDPEQVIEVPKIFPDDVPVQTAVRDTQLAELLVEVPTIVSFSLLQQIMEQNVDIPVPGHGGRFAGLQGFPLEQSSTAPSAQIVHIPVQVEVFKVFAHRRRVFMNTWMILVSGGFRTFPQSKKMRRPQPTRVRGCTPVSAHPRRLLSSVSSTGSWSSPVKGLTVKTAARGETRWKMEDGYLPPSYEPEGFRDD